MIEDFEFLNDEIDENAPTYYLWDESGAYTTYTQILPEGNYTEEQPPLFDPQTERPYRVGSAWEIRRTKQ